MLHNNFVFPQVYLYIKAASFQKCGQLDPAEKS